MGVASGGHWKAGRVYGRVLFRRTDPSLLPSLHFVFRVGMTSYVSNPSWDLVLTFDPQLQQGPFSYSFCLFIYISVHVVQIFFKFFYSLFHRIVF